MNNDIPIDLTLRDYFAAKAMQVILKGAVDNPSKGEVIRDLVAGASYDIADLMIKERAKK